ncbi:unnamed protein product [Closterium sp. Naga37s-1]|nr:unnamed protein product [Closterium sp. Naga37s-1]
MLQVFNSPGLYPGTWPAGPEKSGRNDPKGAGAEESEEEEAAKRGREGERGGEREMGAKAGEGRGEKGEGGEEIMEEGSEEARGRGDQRRKGRCYCGAVCLGAAISTASAGGVSSAALNISSQQGRDLLSAKQAALT